MKIYLGCLILITCSLLGENYIFERQDTCIDYKNGKSSGTVSIRSLLETDISRDVKQDNEGRSIRLSIKNTKFDFQCKKEGQNYCWFDEDIAKIKPLISEVSKNGNTLVFTSEGQIHCRIGEDVFSASDWKTYGEEIYRRLENNKDIIDYFTAGWFIIPTPVLLKVDPTIRVGETVNLPFIFPVPAKTTVSTEQYPEYLVCTGVNDDIAALESNITYCGSDKKYIVFWNVKMYFDLKKQLPVSAVVRRFTKVGDYSDQCQTVSTEMTVKIKP